MAAKHDREREGAEATDADEVEESIVVTVPLPKEALAQIDARVGHPGGRPTRAEVLRRLLRRALDAEEKAAAEERIIN